MRNMIIEKQCWKPVKNENPDGLCLDNWCLNKKLPLQKTALALCYKHSLYWFKSTGTFTKVYQLWHSKYTLNNY